MIIILQNLENTNKVGYTSRVQKQKSREIKIRNHNTKKHTNCNDRRTDRKSVNRRADTQKVKEKRKKKDVH